VTAVQLQTLLDDLRAEGDVVDALVASLPADQWVHRDDTALVTVGADADRWLDIAQSFARPSGSGREPQTLGS
jgi:hypothetical protein